MTKRISLRIALLILLLFAFGGDCGKQPTVTLLGDNPVYITATPIPEQNEFCYEYYDEACAEGCISELNTCVSSCGSDEECASNCEYANYMCPEGCMNYVCEEMINSFCFTANEMIQNTFSGCAVLDQGAAAVDYDGTPLDVVINADTIDCTVPGEYIRTYCANGLETSRCRTKQIIIEADTSPPSLDLRIPTPWRAYVGDIGSNSFSVSAHDGCSFPAVEIDWSYVPADIDGYFNTAGEYPVVFSTVDWVGNPVEDQRIIRVITPYIIFPGPCMSADFPGMDEFGVYLGDYARYCTVSGVICTDQSHCNGGTDFCPNEFVYVGPNNGPYANARDDALVARLKYYENGDLVLDYYDLVTDFDLTPGKCVQEYDINSIHGKLVYACPSTEEYWICQGANDPVACEAEWTWSPNFSRYSIGSKDIVLENCLSRGGGRG